MVGANLPYELPPLPEYTLQPLPPLVPWVSDATLQIVLPIIGYWIVSLIYHGIDVYDLFPQYRLHTPAEILKRNHVTRYEVFRDVIIEQLIQAVFLLLASLMDEPAMYGKADYNIAWYAQKIRLAQRAIPLFLATVGLKPGALASKVMASHPILAAALNGGNYSGLAQTVTIAGQEAMAPVFASWELTLASFVYWYAIPALQFSVGILMLDAWEYALHRAMHMNKWFYVNIHSRHHRLYVPYAYGALYNHPVEGFLMDVLGAGAAYLMTGMTVRQSIWFYSISVTKTVIDHSGYDFPWDPLNFVFTNNAAYHDIHHQTWGIKTNFAQPFFNYWDRIGGTMFEGDAKKKYERSRLAAEQKLAQELENKTTEELVETEDFPPFENDEHARLETASALRIRRKVSSPSQSPAGNFKGLRNKVNESLHGRRASVLGVESSR